MKYSMAIETHFQSLFQMVFRKSLNINTLFFSIFYPNKPYTNNIFFIKKNLLFFFHYNKGRVIWKYKKRENDMFIES